MNKFLTLPNVGVMTQKLSDDDIYLIKQEILDIEKNFSIATPYNSVLAGNILKEYTLKKSYNNLNSIVMNMAAEYDQEYNYLNHCNFLTNSVPLVMSEPWVNFMGKYEFNPPHHHSGVLSFVLWIKIPYSMAEELDQGPGKYSQDPISGKFSFHYNNILGTSTNYHLPVDKTWENVIVLFPAGLTHSVSPFYSSDDYRISVAGNIKFKT